VPGQLRAINGDAADPAAVHRVVRGQQAVIVTLGISESVLRVRLLGASGTPMDTLPMVWYPSTPGRTKHH